jgi:hypothetical protein
MAENTAHLAVGRHADDRGHVILQLICRQSICRRGKAMAYVDPPFAVKASTMIHPASPRHFLITPQLPTRT